MRDRREEDTMVLAIYAKTIVRIIIIAVMLITLAGLAARFAMYMWGVEGYLEALRIFDVGEERSIPGWFGWGRCVGCAVRGAGVGVAKRRRGGRCSLGGGVRAMS